MFGLLVGEFGLRWIEPPPPTQASRFGLHQLRLDRPWLYGLRPGASGYMKERKEILYRINSAGFRDRERTHAKASGVYRIMVLGDSVTFGIGVEASEPFTRVLETTLAERAADASVEVLNFGVGGYNPYIEAELLKDIGRSYEPDLVIVQFCINDFEDPTNHFDAHTKLRLGSIPDAAYPDPSRRRAPFEEGYLPASCWASRICSRVEQALRRTLGRRIAPSEVADRNASTRGVRWRWLGERYAEIEAASATMGASFAVLVVPHRSELSAGSVSGVHRGVVEMARQRGWLLVDPLEAFMRAHRTGVAVFFDEWHPTVEGHRLLAQELLAELSCNGPLPESAKRLCEKE